MEGNINSQMFSSGTKDISQIKAGTVKNYIADSKTLILNNDEKLQLLNNGDRLTIKTAGDQFICTAKVIAKNPKGYTIQITNKLTKKILSGQIIFKSSSVITPEKLAKIINEVAPETANSLSCSANTSKKYKVNIFVKAIENQKIQITYAYKNQTVKVESEQPLSKAQNKELTAETLEQKLSKLGETCFDLDKFEIEQLDSGLFISLSELNNLRRQAVELLEQKIAETEKENPSFSSQTRPRLLLPQGKNIVINNPQEAYLIDNQKALEQLLLEKSVNKKNFKIIYEIPSVFIEENELFNILNAHKDIVLYFNSIFLDEDLIEAINFIKKLENISEREILCENTGLAFELKNLGCKVILGANCNIYNSWNIQNYNETLNLSGVIPSLELSAEQIEKLQFPENLQIWYPKKMHVLLMQSRQCLVKNGSGCQKNHVNKNCVKNCAKQLELYGTQGEKIRAIKRPGFYSALYTSESQNFPCSKSFAQKVSLWIIDKRKF